MQKELKTKKKPKEWYEKLTEEEIQSIIRTNYTHRKLGKEEKETKERLKSRLFIIGMTRLTESIAIFSIGLGIAQYIYKQIKTPTKQEESEE